MENNKLDSNYIIGFVLLFLMYGAYMFFMPETPPDVQEKAKQEVASSAKAAPTLQQDSASLAKSFGSFASFGSGTEVETVIENEDSKIVFTNKGGSIKTFELKNYKTYDTYIADKKEAMKLVHAESSKQRLEVQTPNGKVDLKQLYYSTSAQPRVLKAGDSTQVIYTIALAENQKVEQVYTVYGKGFSVNYDIRFVNVGSQIQNQAVKFSWKDELQLLENDKAENQKGAQINYLSNEGDFEDLGSNSVGNENEKAETPIKWFSFKQKYFVSGFAARGTELQEADFQLTTPTDEKPTYAKLAEASVMLPYENLASNKGNFAFYFGPNDLKTLEPFAEDFHKNVYLGYDIVKPINRFVFVPIFNWFESFVTNYGLLIILVVLLIKIALTPLIYKSYVSSAKMRVMAPEINAIKEKLGDDAMKIQQETMKLYNQVGVSPLSGCVPMLLQMPILMSVFFLFPNMVMFRQQPFLWAKDLSTYDYPISWATNLPIIGNHISLFVVLMTISSLAFTYYNNQITPEQPGPIDMKKISYVFPLVFFFVLNSFPAALSFYYLVSNLVTIAQQLIVRKFIDEDKIKAILENNRITAQTKPPKKQNKFTEYLQKQLQVQEEANKQKADELKKRKKGNS
jgi:YidC/Oxa1 family membrane protein insertase